MITITREQLDQIAYDILNDECADMRLRDLAQSYVRQRMIHEYMSKSVFSRGVDSSDV